MKPRKCEHCLVWQLFNASDGMSLGHLDSELGTKVSRDDLAKSKDYMDKIRTFMEGEMPNCPGYRIFDILAGALSYGNIASGYEFACRNPFIDRGNGEAYRQLMDKVIQYGGEPS